MAGTEDCIRITCTFPPFASAAETYVGPWYGTVTRSPENVPCDTARIPPLRVNVTLPDVSGGRNR